MTDFREFFNDSPGTPIFPDLLFANLLFFSSKIWLYSVEFYCVNNY